MEIIAVTQDAELSNEIIRACNTQGEISIQVLESLNALSGCVGQKHSVSAILIDVNGCTHDEVLAFLSTIRRQQPTVLRILISTTIDLAFVAKAIVAKASAFMLRSEHSSEFGSAVVAACLGEELKHEGAFQRIRAAMPGPPDATGVCTNPLGEEVSLYEAINICDRLGLSVEDISDQLDISYRAVQKALEKKSVVQEDDKKIGFHLPLFGPATKFLVVSIIAFTAMVGLYLAVTADSSNRKPLHGIISGGSWVPKSVSLHPANDDGRPLCKTDVIEGTFTFTTSDGPEPGPYEATITFSAQPMIGFGKKPDSLMADNEVAKEDKPIQQSVVSATNSSSATVSINVPEKSPYVVKISLPATMQ